MLLSESVPHNIATPKHVYHIIESVSANSTLLASPSKHAAAASWRAYNPRCRANLELRSACQRFLRMYAFWIPKSPLREVTDQLAASSLIALSKPDG